MSVRLHDNFESYADAAAVTGWADISGTWRARAAQAVYGSRGFGNAASTDGNIAVNTGVSAVADQRVRVTQTVNLDASANGPNVGVALRCSDDAQNGYFILMRFNSSANSGQCAINIFNRVSGTFNFLSAAANGRTAADGQAWRLLAEVSGTTIRAKLWNADQAEPAGWDISLTDSGVTAAGKFGLYNGTNNGTNGTAGRLPVIDELWFGDVGQSFSYTSADTTVAGEACRILTPIVASATPCIVLHHHGMGETSTGITTDTLKQGIVDSFAEQGWIIAASSAAGNNCGNDAGMNAHRALLGYLLQTYPTAKVLIWGQSAGGLTSLSSIARGQNPRLVGCLLTYPVANLANFYSLGTYAPDIRTAYGIASDGSDYAAKTAGYDPILDEPNRFGRIRYRMYASASDTVVPKASNSDLLQPRLFMAGATESTIIVCSGNHGDASHFQSRDYVAFAARCFADAVDDRVAPDARTAWLIERTLARPALDVVAAVNADATQTTARTNAATAASQATAANTAAAAVKSVTDALSPRLPGSGTLYTGGAITGNITGNLLGSVGSVTGAVGSVTGNVGGSVASVTGAVGSVTGNVGGNVVGSVASVTAAVAVSDKTGFSLSTAGVAAVQSGLSTYAGTDTPGTATLLARASELRLAKLDVAGTLANTANADTFKATGFATPGDVTTAQTALATAIGTKASQSSVNAIPTNPLLTNDPRVPTTGTLATADDVSGAADAIDVPSIDEIKDGIRTELTPELELISGNLDGKVSEAGGSGADPTAIAQALAPLIVGQQVTFPGPMLEDGSIVIYAGDDYTGDPLPFAKTHAGTLPASLELRLIREDVFVTTGDDSPAAMTVTATPTLVGTTLAVAFAATHTQTAALGPGRNGGSTAYRFRVVDPAKPKTHWAGRATVKRRVEAA